MNTRSLLCTLLALSCATAPTTPVTSAEVGPSEGWVPAANAKEALDALWASAPFKVPAATLALASGGRVAHVHAREGLLFENTVRLETGGRGTEVDHSVYRVLNSNPDQTLTFTWSPWRSERPTIRARVISPEGAETWLDPKTIIEGTAQVNGLQLSDVKELQVPMPNVHKGSVIELEVTTVHTRELVEGGGVSNTWNLWSFEPNRRTRLRVDVPAGMPLRLETIGIARPEIRTSGERQSVTLEVGELDFKPFSKSRTQIWAELPSFGWSTADSWETVARRYKPLLDEAFADSFDVASLPRSVTAAKTETEKVQAVISWVSERVRYTAVHLGQGAIVPTKPSVVLSRGYGDCKDLAVLVASILRKVGLNAEVALVSAGGRPASDLVAGIEAFNHMVVVVPQGEKRLWVDATAPSFPVGVVPASVRHRRGLLIAANTKGLISTPTAEETSLGLKQTIDFTLAPFGGGSAKLTLETFGAAEGLYRSQAERCDATAAHGLLEGFVRSTLGDTPFTASVTNCKAGEGPVTVTAEVSDVDRLETGDHVATVALAARIVDLVMPDELIGEAPNADTRSDKQKADDAKRFEDEHGYTRAQTDVGAFSFESKLNVERVVHITMPEAFVTETLPPNRTIAMGPGTWSETFSQPTPTTVEVHFRFEVNQSEWAQADVKAFREALQKRFSENMAQLRFTFAPVKLLNDRHPKEAMVAMKKLLEQKPTDGVLRARYARSLLKLGLGEMAQTESDKAVHDAPNEPLVLMVCGDIARSSPDGLMYREPYHRAKAIDCLRRAHAALPDHNWAAIALADTLRRNDHGELETGWSADASEAAGVLQTLADRKEASTQAMSMLAEMYMRARRSAELTKLIKDTPALLSGANEAINAMAEVLTGGVDATLHRLQQITDSKTKLASFLLAYGTLAQMKRYDEASALMTRFDPGEAVRAQFLSLKGMNDAMKPVPDSVDVSSLEAAAKTLCAGASNGTSPHDISQRWAKLASTTGKAELDGSSQIFNFVHLPTLDSTFIYDQLYHRGKCTISGGAPVARVRCEVPENRAMAITSFWSKAPNGNFALESLGRPSQLANRAWAEMSAHHTEAAVLWLGWLVDELQGRGNAIGGAGSLLKEMWTPTAKDDADALRLSAALGMLVFNDMAKDAPLAVVEAFDKGRSTLSGALKRRADLVLVTALEARSEYARAAKVLEPLAKSENEPFMWQWLASLEAKEGQSASALARAQKALDKDKTNVAWLNVKSTLLMRVGRFDEAFALLKQLQDEKGSAVDVRNNLLWVQTLAGKVDDEAEREAFRLAEEKTVGEAGLNTVSMLMLERGRVVEATDFGNRRRAQMWVSDDAQKLYRGRLLQLLGFNEAASAAYKEISGQDAEWAVLKKHFTTLPVTQNRL